MVSLVSDEGDSITSQSGKDCLAFGLGSQQRDLQNGTVVLGCLDDWERRLWAENHLIG